MKLKYLQECNGYAKFIKLLNKNYKIQKRNIRHLINQLKKGLSSKYQKIKMEILNFLFL
jgi:hypothetical protein